MDLISRAVLPVVGLVLWAGAWGFWKGSRNGGLFTRLLFYPLVLLLYAAGFFIVTVGLGIDHWDDSSAWYWDTWMLVGSTACVGAWYAVSRLTGVTRVVLTAIPLAGLVAFVWLYLSTP